MLAQAVLKLAHGGSATAQAAGAALVTPCVTHAQKQKWILYEVTLSSNVSHYMRTSL
jgi:hypothetical protein